MESFQRRRQTIFPGSKIYDLNTSQTENPQIWQQALKRTSSPTDNSISGNLGSQQGNPKLGIQLWRDKSPWTQYEEFMKKDLAGPTTIALSITKLKAMAIQEIKNCSSKQMNLLQMVVHENIVSIKAGYSYKGSIFLVYDKMDIALKDIIAG